MHSEDGLVDGVEVVGGYCCQTGHNAARRMVYQAREKVTALRRGTGQRRRGRDHRWRLTLGHLRLEGRGEQAGLLHADELVQTCMLMRIGATLSSSLSVRGSAREPPRHPYTQRAGAWPLSSRQTSSLPVEGLRMPYRFRKVWGGELGGADLPDRPRLPAGERCALCFILYNSRPALCVACPSRRSVPHQLPRRAGLLLAA